MQSPEIAPTSGPVWSRGSRWHQGFNLRLLFIFLVLPQTGSFKLEKLAAASSEYESSHHTISKKVSSPAAPKEASVNIL